MARPAAWIAALLVLTLGTVWPTGLDWLQPPALHYAHWPWALKLAGWLTVPALVIGDIVIGLRSGAKTGMPTAKPPH